MKEKENAVPEPLEAAALDNQQTAVNEKEKITWVTTMDCKISVVISDTLLFMFYCNLQICCFEPLANVEQAVERSAANVMFT